MSEKVKKMFDTIANHYDLMNTILSFGIHHFWRRKAVKLSTAKSGDFVLDCATGTGDLAIRFLKAVKNEGKVIGIDFSIEMLRLAKSKIHSKNLKINFLNGDILRLPFKDNSFEISNIAFGIRNVDSPIEGLKEMSRVVKPGGKIIVLEFGQPKGFFSLIYKFYSKFIIPSIGKLLSSDKNAYNYLPETASRFLSEDKFISLMTQTEMLKDCYLRKLTFGIAFIYVGTVFKR